MDGEYAPSTSARSRKQVAEFEASGGTRANTMRGYPIVVVTMLGARSGKVRKVPLMRVEHDGQFLAVASLGGAPRHPEWYHNLRAHPHAQVQDGAGVVATTARELAGEERALWWDRAVAAFPDYAAYQRRTARQIPVFVLEPDEG
ncbi:nitroreductase family deazaflavin-dependent oxidoreductase [Georgenia yuyongxinii]|uniref:Nitroreductase family deazaflavin-dependent oxidoreductase n=1 Tax=Georgenia yuyongxinii TaxID=2589797 RepID=A0A552WUV5_9MICO|nr:nitroreductase family deazaflavin-dependent oxidoreductase [Georgenia yuyongxinii]TRW46628.1 nitroreductase family deazaflavin-dependent oxidoreductase [Georgenia yuyongxinii]